MSVFDIQSLLEPISDSQPSGIDQSGTSQYLQIIDAMKEDDPNLSRQDWEELKVADWGKVLSLSDTLLSTKTKDIQLVVWMIEAGIRKEGIAALNDGIQLLTQVIDTFWETLFPALEEPNDLYRRMNVINKFFAKFEEKANILSITQPSSTEYSQYTWGNYLECSYIDKMSETEKKEANQNGRPTAYLFNGAVQSTPTEFYTEFKELIELSVESAQNLENVLQSKVEPLRNDLDEQSDADFSFNQLYETLGLIQKWVARILSERGVGNVPDNAVESVTQDGTTILTRQAGTDINAITSREEAYNAIHRISDFLMRIEPHSPVPYLLKRAAKWGRMSAQELLEELYNNASDTKQLFKLLDIVTEEQQTSNTSASSGW
ncbi:MAG: type VI secretion system protein TssA [Bacteriodetes bacterium]|nr:type VI secretion system protein TssA [Bacteroidota bacterium]